MANERFKVKFGLAVGDTSATIDATTGDIVTNGDITLGGGDIKSPGGTTAISVSGADTLLSGDLQVSGNDIKSSIGSTSITLSGQNVSVIGDLSILGNNIKSSTGATAITLNAANATVVGDLTVSGNDIKSSSATAITLSGANVAVAGDLNVNGGELTIAAPGYIYSATGLAAIVSGNDVTVQGDLTVSGNDIKSSSATAITLSGADVAVAGDLTVTGNDIKSSSATAITLSGTNVTIAGDLEIDGNDIKSSTGATAITLSGANVTVVGDLEIDGNDIKSSTGATAITLSGNDIAVAGDLTVTGNDIKGSSGFTAITLSSTNATVAGDLGVNGGDITTNQSTAAVFNTTATTVNIAGAATTVSIGANTGTTTINNSLVADDISIATVDATNLEVTNIKAKDGTAAMSIADTTGVVTVSTELNVDNINISGNTISSTNTNGAINLTPNGTGTVVIPTADITNLDVTNIRALDGTASIVIANTTGEVSISTDLTVAKSVSTGNAVLGASGEIITQSTLNATGGVSGAIPLIGVLTANAQSGFAGSALIVDHGQNRAGGTATTAGTASVYLASSRGTAAAPTATGNGDTYATLNFAGHDGVRSLATINNGASVQFFATALGAYTNNGTETTNAGAACVLRVQPQNLRLTSASRQRVFTQAQTLVTNAPPTMNIFWNDFSMTTQFDGATGTAYNGFGKQIHQYFHPQFQIYGVPSQSTGNVDNLNLAGTNTIQFFSNRQSAWSGRRDAVETGDTLAQISVNGQTGTNSTGLGAQTGTLDWTAAENFSPSNTGSRFRIATGNIGSNILNDRLVLDSNTGTVTTNNLVVNRSSGGVVPLLNLASDNTTVGCTRTQYRTSDASYGGEISMKAGILNGAGGYDRTTELSVTALTTDGSQPAVYETKTNRYDGVNYSPTQNNDTLGVFSFLGNYSTGTSPLTASKAASISVRANENFTGTASGTSMQFNVTETGTLNTLSVLDLSSAQSTYKSDRFQFRNSDGDNYLAVEKIVNPGNQFVQLALIQNRAATADDTAVFNFATERSVDGVNYTPTLANDNLGAFKFNGNANTGTIPGVPGAPAAQISCAATENWTNTANGSQFRFSAIKTGTLNSIEIITGNADATRFRSDEFEFLDSSNNRYLDISNSRAKFTRPVEFPAYTATAAAAITGSVGQQIAISDAGGKMAYWDTTNNRWSYIFDNSAV